MPDVATIQEIGTAVNLLRDEVKSLRPDPEKLARINVLLDEHEEKVSQPLTLATQLAAKNEAEIVDLKTDLEAKGVEAGEARTRVDALELQLARTGGSIRIENFKDSEEYKALNDYCRHGLGNMTSEQKQLLRTDSGVEGGFLLSPTELDSSITKIITEIDGIRSIARVRTISSKSMEVPIRNVIPVAVYEGEQETGTDDVSTYASETLTPFRQTFTSPITVDMLMDSAFDMEAEIASDAAEAFAFGEGAAFVNGTGFKEPEGFLTNATIIAGEREGAAGGAKLHAQDVILLTGDLKFGYNPVYVLNRRTLADLRSLRADSGQAADDGKGQFLWNPGIMDPLAAGAVGNNTINGFPYVLANSMPDADTATNRPIAFGDFRRGYTIVDRTGMSVIRDEFTLKKRAIVEFTMNRWNTGQVTLAEAITILQITA